MLCDECQPKYDAWLQPRQLFIENRLDYIGRDTPRGRGRKKREQADRWYRTVNFQLDLITRICATQHRSGQQALFEMETT